MDFFFNPRGVAIVGATPNRDKVGYAMVKNVTTGYDGKVYPVNPRYLEMEGRKCYPSVTQVPDPVDLAIVFVPAGKVPEVLRQCAQRGIRGVMVESAGFAEVGPAGKSLQDEMIRIARANGMRIWGPNCMGLVDANRGYVFSFVSPSIWEEGLVAGKVSLVVQSGLLAAGFLIDLMAHSSLGISKACSIGNKADVDECDVLQYLLQDPLTAAVALYVESISDGPRFMEICRTSSKPIVVLKGGTSEEGAVAAMSHTGSMAGNAEIVRGVLRQVGVVQARDFNEMTDVAKALATYPKPVLEQPARVAILTFSGAAGIVSADLMAQQGLRVARLSTETIKKLEGVYPEWMPPSNPVDLWPAIERVGPETAYTEAFRAVCADPGVDAVLLHLFIGGVARYVDLSPFAALAREARKPLFVWILGMREEVREFQRSALAMDVPVYREIRRAVDAMAAVLGP